MDATREPPGVRFGPYVADFATGELRRDGAKVPLQDKPFQILVLLLRRPGELVTREELRSRLWPADTFVDFEHGLNTAVKKLRQALDDSAEEPRFVETLPRRGYRFIAPVEGTSPDAGLAPGRRHLRRCHRWRRPRRRGGSSTLAWGMAVTVALAAPFLIRHDARPAPGPPPNARPVVVLMDSPLPGRVYDPRTAAAGGTNADDLTDALSALPVAIQKENTSAIWHREEQLVRQNPDLIVSHLSCLLDERLGEPTADGPVFRHLFELAASRLVAVFGYVAASNPRTQFIVYSRGYFVPPGRAARFVAEAETRFPALRGRLQTYNVPGGMERATFRDPSTAAAIRERVRSGAPASVGGSRELAAVDDGGGRPRPYRVFGSHSVQRQAERGPEEDAHLLAGDGGDGTVGAPAAPGDDAAAGQLLDPPAERAGRGHVPEHGRAAGRRGETRGRACAARIRSSPGG